MNENMKLFFVIAGLTVIIVFMSGVWAQELRGENVSGTCIKETENERAELEVELLADGNVHVRGIALWGTNRKYGPNIGQLDFKAFLKKGRVEYKEIGKGQHYKLELTFTKRGLLAKEDGISTNFGMNVNFAGVYKKR